MIVTPASDTWTANQLVNADQLNANIRDAQQFLIYAPLTIVTRAAAQTVINGDSVIIWDNEIIDTDGTFTAPSTDIVVQRPGVYALQMQSQFPNNNTGSRSAKISINGVDFAIAKNMSANGRYTCINAACIAALAKGDIINGKVYQDSGISLSIGNSSPPGMPRLAMRLISVAAIDIDYTDPSAPVTKPPVPPSSPPPTGKIPVKHVTSYNALWSRTFNGDGSTTWDDSAHCYQGFYDSNRGNTKSVIGFDYAAIQTALTGATNISVTFSFRPAHTYSFAGATILIDATAWTAKPSTWASTRNFPLMQKSACKANTNYTVSLPSGVGAKFQKGGYLGMGFGPAPSTDRNYYAYMNGATESGRPSLTFTYWK
jgi:hypothetical protein